MSLKSIENETPTDYYKNGLYSKYLRIYVPYGYGLNMSSEDYINLISYPVIKGNRVTFTLKWQLLPNAEYRKAMKSLNGAIKNNDSEFEGNSVSAKGIKFATEKHIRDFLSEQANEKVPAVVYERVIGVSSTWKERIFRQIKVIKNRWTGEDGYIQKFATVDNNGQKKVVDVNPLKEFELVDIVGTNKSIRSEMFTKLEPTNNLTTKSTVSNFAGIGFFPRATLQDELGLEMGFDFLAPTQMTEDGGTQPKTVIDNFRGFQSVALIAHPRGLSREDYVFDSLYKLGEVKAQSQASVMAQAVANQHILEGKKVIHLVLNDFDYFDLKTARPETEMYQSITKTFTQNIQCSEVSVNPFQPFAKKVDVESSNQSTEFSLVKKKFNTLVHTLNLFTLSDRANGMIDDVFVNLNEAAGVYDTLADQYIDRRMYLERGNDKYPHMASAIMAFGEKERVLRSANKADQASVAEIIKISIENFMSEKRNLIGNYTTLGLDSTKDQFYLRTDGLSRLQKNVQAINLMDFIRQNLERGDLLVIHGTEQIDARVFENYLGDQLKALRQKGIKILAAFDTTDDYQKATKNDLGTSTAFMLRKYGLFEDYQKDIDFMYCGRLDDFTNLEILLGERLPAIITDSIGGVIKGRDLFHRRSTGTLELLGMRCDI